MSYKLRQISTVFVTVLGIGLLSPVVSAAEKSPKIITVEGVASVKAAADLASFRVGIDTSAKTAQQAIAQNSELVQEAIKVLDSFDIEKEQRQTSNYQLRQQFDYGYNRDNNEPPKLIGYEVNYELAVSQIKVEKLGELLDKLVSNGVNNINAINFESSKAAQNTSKARALAVKDAKQKAEEIADALDVDLDGVQSISEVSSYNVPLVQESFALQADAKRSVPVEQGQVSHQVKVQAEFLIED